MKKFTALYQSPIGQIIICGCESGISSISFSQEAVPDQHQLLPTCLQEAVEQLHEYFCHQRKHFDLFLKIKGTEFQQKVWNSLLNIPWGETISYTQLAKQNGVAEAMRAVGAANAQNPFLIVLPCHRVIGSSGMLAGYAGGLLRKQWLLKHEKQNLQFEIS